MSTRLICHQHNHMLLKLRQQVESPITRNTISNPRYCNRHQLHMARLAHIPNMLTLAVSHRPNRARSLRQRQ